MSLAPATPESEFSRLLPLVADHIKARSDNLSELPTLPRREDIACALESLPAALPDQGLGTEKTVRHLLDEVVMGLGCGQAGPRVRDLASARLRGTRKVTQTDHCRADLTCR